MGNRARRLIAAAALCAGCGAPRAAPQRHVEARAIDAGAPAPAGFTATMYGKPFVLRSAVAIGLATEDGVDRKTLVLSDRADTCEQAVAAWGSNRTDNTIVVSMIGWQDGYVTHYDGGNGWSANFSGLDPAFDWVDGGQVGDEIAVGQVTTRTAATAIGGHGRVSISLRAAEGDDRASGEVDVVQCE